jgi:Phage tail protein
MPIVLPPQVADLGEGSLTDRVLGTGVSLPGLDGYYQYNGLLFNVRDWYDTFLLRQIDGLDDADIRTGASNNPGDHGETPTNAYYGGRTIVFAGDIRYFHYPKLRDLRQGLRDAFADIRSEKPLWIRHPSGNLQLDRIVYCKKQGKLELPDLSQRIPTFSITLRASNPRIMSYILYSQTISAGQTKVLVNDGNIFAEPRIRFYGDGTLTRTAVGVTQTMVVTGVPSGGYIEVDYSRRNSRVLDNDGNNAYANLSDDSDRIELEGGSGGNSVTFTGTGSVLIAYRDSWV